jgi:hypothetical protein
MSYELPNMIMAILFNSYVLDPYFIGWSVRCEHLSCSWCMNRCILLSCSYYLFLSNLLWEHVWGMVCVIWSNLVVIVACDNNFIATMVFINSFITSLGIKRIHVWYYWQLRIPAYIHGHQTIVICSCTVAHLILCKFLILDSWSWFLSSGV